MSRKQVFLGFMEALTSGARGARSSVSAPKLPVHSIGHPSTGVPPLPHSQNFMVHRVASLASSVALEPSMSTKPLNRSLLSKGINLAKAIGGFILVGAYLKSVFDDFITLPESVDMADLNDAGIRHIYEMSHLGVAEGDSGHHAPELYRLSDGGHEGYVKEVSLKQLTNEILIGRVYERAMSDVFGPGSAPHVEIVSNASSPDQDSAHLCLFSQRLLTDSMNMEHFLDGIEEPDVGVSGSKFGAALAIAGLLADDRELKNFVIAREDEQLIAYSIDHEFFPSATTAVFDFSLPRDDAIKAFFNSGAIYKYRIPSFQERMLSDTLVAEYRDDKFYACQAMFEEDLDNGNVMRVYQAFAALDEAQILALFSDEERSLLSSQQFKDTLTMIKDSIRQARKVLNKAGVELADEADESDMHRLPGLS